MDGIDGASSPADVFDEGTLSSGKGKGEARKARAIDDEELIITGNGELQLELVRTIEGTGPIECLKYSNDILATGGRCTTTNIGSITLYSLSKGTRLRTLWPTSTSPHDISSITCLDLTATRVAAAWKNTIRVWDTAGTPIATLPKPAANITTVKVVGERIVETCAFGSVSVWDLRKETMVGSVATVPGILCASLDEDERGIDVICGYKDGNLRGFEIQPTPSFPSTSTGTFSSLSDWITCVHADPVTGIVVAGSWDGRVRVWDRRGREEGGVLRRTLVTSEARSAVLCVAGVGRVIVTGCYDGGVVVWEVGER
ncbi:WD40-repeat-containing domain protein [Chytridium lagenaria]|nr:WD40-repeat-containing domain protein [Chytridium lagenaria]